MKPPPRRGAALRRAFLDYFAARDHAVVQSSPLVPQDDPTLLFANAGMNQFKNYFLGRERPPRPRAVSIQKCVRAGGKHNDLENVGFTARHHTFFEMLGNFSFGDYFKEEAIALAWEFLTRELGLPPDRLSVSVFAGDEGTPPDDEARRFWRAHVPEERIAALPASENFWSMGDTGPCGPCSEIHYDLGPEFEGDDRHLEIWNLVFMQFDRDEAGALTPLPAPSVDTGMGLERLASVMQGVPSNYDTDLFEPLLRAVRERASADADPETVRAASRVIADHSRAAAFLVSGGVLPANDGRGYVLRKILRRALRFGRKAGISDRFLSDATGLAIAGLEDAWPELGLSRELVGRVAAFEEERFTGTVAAAMSQLDRVLERESARAGTQVPGDDVFRLYDTFGLPPDLVEEVARERGMTVDSGGFEVRMREQRERARRSWKGKPAAAPAAYREIAGRTGGGGPTPFTGYESTETGGVRVLAALAPNEDGVPEAAPALGEGREGELILERTPFYPEGGGQVGDRGVIRSEGGVAEVLDTRAQDGLVVHSVRVREGAIGAGEKAEALVDRARRAGAAEHHTMTHLLHAALRDTLGPHVKQAGSLVAPDRLRFDFTHFAALTPAEIETIEGRVNEQIRADREVLAGVMPLDRALSPRRARLLRRQVRNRGAGDRSARFQHRTLRRHPPAGDRRGGPLRHRGGGIRRRRSAPDRGADRTDGARAGGPGPPAAPGHRTRRQHPAGRGRPEGGKDALRPSADGTRGGTAPRPPRARRAGGDPPPAPPPEPKRSRAFWSGRRRRSTACRSTNTADWWMPSATGRTAAPSWRSRPPSATGARR